MAAKHKTITGALFRAFSARKPSFSDSIWKGSLVGAKIHTTTTKEAGNPGTSHFKSFINRALEDDNKPKNGGTSRLMNFVEGALEEDNKSRNVLGFRRQQIPEESLDIVHIKLLKNNTFVTVTDSKGNKKLGASSGCVEGVNGGPKLSRYAAEATAEHVGRLSRNLGLKSVIMRVNGFTYFRKKKQAILSWREGYNFGRGDRTPIAYIEDTTRRAHNGCRLPKKRRY